MARPLRPQTAFAERLIQARGEMSRIDVAQKLDVNIETLGGYERGKNAPPYSFLADIKALYGVSLDWLITGEGEMRPVAVALQQPATEWDTSAPALDERRMRSAVKVLAKMVEEEDHIRSAPEIWPDIVMDTYQFLISTPDAEKRRMIAAEKAKTDRKAG